MKGTLALSNAAVVRSRELEPETFIPYVRHIDNITIALDSRALMVTVALDGVSFETADTVDLNALHRDLNTLYRNIADERLALWTHIIRRRDNSYPEGIYRNAFAERLNNRYRQRVTGEDLFRNDLYLSLVWHPGKDPAEKITTLMLRLRKVRREGVELDHNALKRLHDAVTDVTAGLKHFGPRVLSLYEKNGIPFSEPSEVLHQLHRRPLRTGAAHRRANFIGNLFGSGDLWPRDDRNPVRGNKPLCGDVRLQGISSSNAAGNARWAADCTLRADPHAELCLYIEVGRQDHYGAKAEPDAQRRRQSQFSSGRP